MNKKHTVLFVFLLIAALLLTACSPKTDYLPKDKDNNNNNKDAEFSYNTVSADDAASLFSSGSAVAVDTRKPTEYKEGHIPSAVSLAYAELGDGPSFILPVMDANYILYGDDAVRVAEKLTDSGYSNVSVLNDYSSLTTEKGAAEAKAGGTNSFSSFLLNGVPVDEDIFKDYKLTMVNVWATDCSPCLNEMPHLSDLADNYKAKGFQIVGLVSDVGMSDNGIYLEQDLALARRLVDMTGASNYRHMIPSSTLYTAVLQAIYSVPTTFFVDSEGIIVGDVYYGYRDYESWAAIVEELL